MSDSESVGSASLNANSKNQEPKNGKASKLETQSQQNERAHTATSSLDNDNPFKIPSDELIFTFKDDEKNRKIAEREVNKQLKLWEKNRPIREGCLRKLRETDIQPSGIAINSKITSKVNMNEFNSFTVPIERPKHQENTHQLKEKKRQIFLAQQLNETKYAEIERLANHNEMRQMGLLCSEKMLESDTKAFLDFFAKIKSETNAAAQQLDALKKQKQEAQLEYRNINDECGTINSQINKNLEVLDRLLHYKDFLDDLTPDVEKEAIAKRKEDKKIIILQSSEFKSKQKENDPSKGNRNRSKERHTTQNDEEKPQSILDEVVQNKKLKELIKTEEDDHSVYFKDYKEMMQIFEGLEDKNLSLIQQGQENEEQIEEKNRDIAKLSQLVAEKMNFLEVKENTIQSRLEKTKREFNNIRQQTADGENKTISPKTYQTITDKMNKILKTLAAESKQVSPLMKMTEIEKQIEIAEASIQRWKQLDEENDTKYFADNLEFVKKEYGNNKRIADKLKEEAENEKERAAKELRQQKNYVFSPKRKMMDISQKRKVKKQVEKKIELTQQQQDEKKYLGEVLQGFVAKM